MLDLSAAMKERRRDLASANLWWEKMGRRTARRGSGDRVMEGGRWVCDHLKNEIRVVGLWKRGFERRMEIRRLGFEERWGMKGFRVWGLNCGVKVRVFVRVLRSSGAVFENSAMAAEVWKMAVK
ncbi:hypothetical protein M5689_001690 [Euphorbia peplus]|nr:hypothetical protein M5689_001690 [Euphorbia peplus]